MENEKQELTNTDSNSVTVAGYKFFGERRRIWGIIQN